MEGKKGRRNELNRTEEGSSTSLSSDAGEGKKMGWRRTGKSAHPKDIPMLEMSPGKDPWRIFSSNFRDTKKA